MCPAVDNNVTRTEHCGGPREIVIVKAVSIEAQSQSRLEICLDSCSIVSHSYNRRAESWNTPAH
jgi:hypothetical protein